MLAGSGGSQHSAVVQKIGDADIHHIAARFGDGFVEITERFRDVVLFGEGFGAFRFAGENGYDLGLGDESMIGFEVDVRDESRAEQGDFGFGHWPYFAP